MGIVWDAKTRGLGLRTYAGGTKSYVFVYRNIDGRQRMIIVGRWPEWSVQAARDRVKELRREVDLGRDPAGEKRERRDAPTVQDLVDRYVAEHLMVKGSRVRKLAQVHLRKTVEYRITDEKKVLDEIARRLGAHSKVADIHGGDIREMHRGLTESRGAVRANRILGVTSKMFALSLVPMAGENAPWRDQAQGNPCKYIARNYEEGRQRFFSASELAAISDALNEYGKAARGGGMASARAAADCARLIMLTGCRPQEARFARWPEFDSEPGIWVKPSAHMKSEREHRLPLNPAALELIERLRKKRKEGATWLFAGQRRGEPLKSLVEVWRWVRHRAGFGPDARLYDLRHTFASVGAGGGLSLPIIGRLLGHTRPQTTARYAHLADDPLREATDKIGAVIAGATNGNGGAEVVRIRNKG
jgi:integrase